MNSPLDEFKMSIIGGAVSSHFIFNGFDKHECTVALKSNSSYHLNINLSMSQGGNHALATTKNNSALGFAWPFGRMFQRPGEPGL
jgi:hypothetical protein